MKDITICILIITVLSLSGCLTDKDKETFNGLEVKDVPIDVNKNCRTINELCRKYPQTHSCLKEGIVYPDVIKECQLLITQCWNNHKFNQKEEERIRKFISEIHNQGEMCKFMKNN